MATAQLFEGPPAGGSGLLRRVIPQGPAQHFQTPGGAPLCGQRDIYGTGWPRTFYTSVAANVTCRKCARALLKRGEA